ncbi:MAG: AAA family ATPase, partial [Alphaproteobacteria bacterium]
IYAPVKQSNRATGVAAFTYRPPGAGNSRDEAIEVVDPMAVAQALFVDKRPVRIKPMVGGSANYLTYPSPKFASFWLRPDIAAGLGLALPIVSSPVPHASAEITSTMTNEPTNLILFGPPGTGKTWTTANEAVRLCDGEDNVPKDRDVLMARYRALLAQKRIAFVTFHQSMDYETFVEGLRPETDASDSGEAGFRLEPKPGIFREVCSLANDARTRARGGASDGFNFEGRRFWKMSLGAAGVEDDIYEAARDGDYLVIGWGGDVDWSHSRFDNAKEIQREWTSVPRASESPSNYSQLAPFRNELKIGDLVIVPYGNTAFRAVAQVKGDYEYVPGQDGNYCHRRKVDWLLKLDEPLPLDTIIDGKFTMRTFYSIAPNRVNRAALSRLIGGDDTPADGPPDQFVLIIDEINRANVSKVLGELITLIEPDKRLGQANELKLTLPHSRLPFGVPDNLHIVGTMNTADRSIALLDTALRRRFQFKEMAPKPQVLSDASKATGLPLEAALRAMNDRIEYLLDRDHRIGHAYLVNCRTAPQVEMAFRDKIIPLLQEYFFEDWSRVAAVLNEKRPTGAKHQGSFLDCTLLKDPTGQGGPNRQSWSVRSDAFRPEAYQQLVGRLQDDGEFALADETLSSPEEEGAGA